jgi:hypothetical protein
MFEEFSNKQADIGPGVGAGCGIGILVYFVA